MGMHVVGANPPHLKPASMLGVHHHPQFVRESSVLTLTCSYTPIRISNSHIMCELCYTMFKLDPAAIETGMQSAVSGSLQLNQVGCFRGSGPE